MLSLDKYKSQLLIFQKVVITYSNLEQISIVLSNFVQLFRLFVMLEQIFTNFNDFEQTYITFLPIKHNLLVSTGQMSEHRAVSRLYWH